MHYDGFTWNIVNHDLTDYSLYSIWGSSSTDVYAVGANRILFYNGNTWSRIDNNFTTNNLYGIWGSSSRDIYAVGEENTILLKGWIFDVFVPAVLR